ENFPVDIALLDDGTNGDAVAGDSRYSRLLTFYPFQLPEYRYEMNVVAIDSDGDVSARMPYVISVESAGGSNTGSGPVLSGRYVWYEPVVPGEAMDGFLWILVRVEHPLGNERIADVILRLDGADTGIRLTDDGDIGDLACEDGLYGAFITYNGQVIPEPISLIFDVVAVDVNGLESRAWPVAWKTMSYMD
ncbi:hypothetical protein JXA80_02845, partial [bacterium]|nr:hypothetical protein [candidate division CSSED10-310 bacterium]